MKKATVSVTFEDEKLNAIKQFMGKKNSDLQTELDDAMQKLYEKYVPATIREYIESKNAGQDETPRRSIQAHEQLFEKNPIVKEK